MLSAPLWRPILRIVHFFVRIEKYDLRRTSFSKVRLAHSNADGFFIFRIEFNLCDKLIEKRYNNCFLIVI